MALKHPYRDQPDKAFWDRAVSKRSVSDLTQLTRDLPDLENGSVATAGSCFAHHMGQAMRKAGLSYLDLEPTPAILSAENARRLGYGLYSCRYGNIYTTRQLVQLFDEADGKRVPEEAVWKRKGRYYDALRPGIEHGGFSCVEEVKALRQAHLNCVQEMFSRLDIFVFTLGLTETWVSRLDGTAYPSAPGVIAGKYKQDAYDFVNLRYGDVYEDLKNFRDRLKSVNDDAKLLLTVSPVPLAATATQNHVLPATTYSKSVLRAAAGDMAEDFDDVSYFPSFELITGQPGRHGFYESDLRSVTDEGVSEVMSHLFSDFPDARKELSDAIDFDDDFGYEHCEEGLLLSD